jgi:hypothetical protein
MSQKAEAVWLLEGSLFGRWGLHLPNWPRLVSNHDPPQSSKQLRLQVWGYFMFENACKLLWLWWHVGEAEVRESRVQGQPGYIARTLS